MLESPDSSSPLVTRAVSAGLAGTGFNPYHLAGWQKIALKALGYLPSRLSRYLIPRVGSFSSINPARLNGITIDYLADIRLMDYADLNRKVPAITIGAALGGASAFLALAMDSPFLPQAYVMTLKGGSLNGEADVYFQRAATIALELANADPNILTIQHYDPIHDEWLTRRVNHLRFKLLSLPSSYKRFIKQNLLPGGSICLLDCQAQWLRYRVGERSIFQIGGWGDITAEEFINGSPRIAEYANRVGLKTTDWRLPGFPLETGPESEWGTEPGLGESVQDFCKQEGYQFVRIRLPEPHDYSRLSFQVMQSILEIEGRPPAGVLIEMFSQFDPFSCLQAGLLPLWLIFNTWDSLRFLQEMSPLFPKDRPVFFSPLSTFTLTPDLVPWQEWEKALQGFDMRNVGVRPAYYPSDPHTLIDWAKPLRQWVSENGTPVRERLSAQEVQKLAYSKITSGAT